MFTAIILAGGRSSRMGRPKALLPFDGEPLIAHIVRRLETLFDDIIVVAAERQELPVLPVTVVHDEVPSQGPVGGISYGLNAARSDYAFATSCDSAFISIDLVSHLVSICGGYDVVVPRWNGRLQPLHAVYRKTVLPVLTSQLAADALRLTDVLTKVRTRVVEEEEIQQFDPDGSSFFNINTPDDYAVALSRWRTPS